MAGKSVIRKLLLCIALLLCVSSLSAQQRGRAGKSQRKSQPAAQRKPSTQQRVQNLQQQRTQIQKGLTQSKQQLNQTQHAAERNSQSLEFIHTQLQNRLAYISILEADMDSLDRLITSIERNIEQIDSQLHVRKQRYKHSLRHAHASAGNRSPILYIMSGDDFEQIYRRMRHNREYASYQRTQGYQLLEEQNQLRAEQNHLLQVKQEKSLVLKEMIGQRQQLAQQQTSQQRTAQQLKQQQQDIQNRIKQQQQQLAQLNKSIDQAIAEMEAERRRQAEEAARRAAAARNSNKGNKGNKGNNSSKGNKGGVAAPAPSQWLTAKDRELNGNLEQNRGRLPVPITGTYRIYRRHGMNQVTPGVTWENRGIDYMGRSGAQARSVFDGEVSRVIKIGSTMHVLVRHGSYISVYSNLATVAVKKGQQIKARQTIGSVAANDEGLFILQFQLRKETTKLNPEQWIAK